MPARSLRLSASGRRQAVWIMAPEKRAGLAEGCLLWGLSGGWVALVCSLWSSGLLLGVAGWALVMGGCLQRSSGGGRGIAAIRMVNRVVRVGTGGRGGASFGGGVVDAFIEGSSQGEDKHGWCCCVSDRFEDAVGGWQGVRERCL